MSKVERFDVWRQRQAVLAVAHDPEFLTTAEGVAFMEQMRLFLAPGVLGYAHSRGLIGDGLVEPDDVVHTVIERLKAHGGKVAEYAAGAEKEPWNYLGQCLIGWLRQQWGVRGVSLEPLVEFLPPIPAIAESESVLTPLPEVVSLTYEVLAPLTPQKWWAPLLELLGWLAANPVQRLSYETAEKVAAHRHCPEFTIEQVSAVMNIAWGGRPRQSETSLMGQFLLDPKFRPSDSPTHARAMAFYKRAIRAGARGSRMLTDWTS